MRKNGKPKREKIKSLDRSLLPELPENWAWARIVDLAADEPNAITDGPFGSNLKTSHYTESGPRVIRLQNIGDGEFINEMAHISNKHFQSLSRHHVNGGDLVIAGLGETLPRSCVIPDWVGPALVKADCPRFKPNQSLVGPDYVNFALNSSEIRSRTSAIIHGVGRPRLNLSEIRGIWIPVAPRNEQRRIVAKIEELFSDLDAGVAALERAKANLKRYRAAVLKAAVEGRLVDPHGNAHHFEPSNWVSIGHAIDSLGQGWSPKCKRTPSESDEIWGVIKTSAVQPLEFWENENKELPDSLEARPALELQKDDLLITRAGPRSRCGVTCLVRSTRPKLIVCDKVYRIRCNREVANPGFLEVVLNAPPIIAAIEKLKTGISDSGLNLTQTKFRKLQIPLPPLEIQSQIEKEVQRFCSIIEDAERAINISLIRSARLRQAILRRAFSGQLVPQDSRDKPASELLARHNGGQSS